MTSDFNIKQFVTQLTQLLDTLPETSLEDKALNAKSAKKLKDDIERALKQLGSLRTQIDPVAQPAYVLDPADPQVMGELIARTLLQQNERRLNDLSAFHGSGVYALYYRGEFDAYKILGASQTPVYVGKADPVNPQANTPEEQGRRLERRLKDHKKSITQAENLSLSEFTYRYLVVVSAWQSTAEQYLIDRFRPIWNNESGICFGFGKHGDKAGTRQNLRSPWDTIHPGRPWAKDSPANELTKRQILNSIRRHLKENPPER